jgi:hypothetical protein
MIAPHGASRIMWRQGGKVTMTLVTTFVSALANDI